MTYNVYGETLNLAQSTEGQYACFKHVTTALHIHCILSYILNIMNVSCCDVCQHV